MEKVNWKLHNDIVVRINYINNKINLELNKVLQHHVESDITSITTNVLTTSESIAIPHDRLYLQYV